MKKIFFLIFVIAVGCAPLPKGSVAPSGQKATQILKDGVKFVYLGNAGSVFVAGSFNNWSTNANPLRQVKPGVWETKLSLSPGTYQYKFVVDGNWVPDPNNPNTADDGFGGVNSVVVVTSGKAAKAGSSLKQATAPKKVEGGILFSYNAPDAASVVIAGSFNNWNTNASPLKKNKNGIWTIVLPLSSGTYQYKFVVDGNWVPDPNNPNTADDGYGGVNSVVNVKSNKEGLRWQKLP
ncbi:MAG: glycogen-binding domain-containing protein [Elusimicrobia bacterium]|nr:glycogen-binding domain-containing protein [Elusimicrobiota bacterium]